MKDVKGDMLQIHRLMSKQSVLLNVSRYRKMRVVENSAGDRCKEERTDKDQREGGSARGGVTQVRRQ